MSRERLTENPFTQKGKLQVQVWTSAEFAIETGLAPVLQEDIGKCGLSSDRKDIASDSLELLQDLNMRCLVVYSSKYGQTEKIAERMAEAMRSAMAEVDVQSVEKLTDPVYPEAYDVIVLGSPIYFSKHAELIRRLVAGNMAALNNKVSAFFSVSLSASGNEKQRADANQCVDDFLKKLDWTPAARAIFGGGLNYRRYGWFTRLLMKWISWREGGDTDTSRDHEYTDWNAVDAFALDVLAVASTGKVKHAEAQAVHSEINQVVRVVDYDPPAASR